MSGRKAMSRRSALKAGLAVMSGGVIAASTSVQAARAAAADELPPKLSKERVHYQWKPSASGSHCSICANFVAPSSCRIVEGVISGGGYCLVYSPQDIDLYKEP
jgi:hypothetical protein